MHRLIPLVLALVALTAGPARAQDEEPARPVDGTIRLLFSASIQARASYGWDNDLDRDRLGFGVRRARFRSEFIFTPKASLALQFEASDKSLTAQDVFLAYQVTPALRMRVGRYLVPQPRSFIFTPQSRLDGVDRAAIGEIWGRHTVGENGRDFGIDATWQTSASTFQLSVSNGDGSWDRLQGNYRGTISNGNPTDGVHRTAINLGASGSVRPTALKGLETGAFITHNTARGPNTAPSGGPGRVYTSYGAHLYWGAEPGSQPVRLKADLLGIQYEQADVVPRGDDIAYRFRQQEFGLALTAAVSPTRYTDVFARIERYRPNILSGQEAYPELNVTDTFFSTGLSFSPSARRGGPFYRERFTLVYNNLYPDGSGHRSKHQVVFQAQLFI